MRNPDNPREGVVRLPDDVWRWTKLIAVLLYTLGRLCDRPMTSGVRFGIIAAFHSVVDVTAFSLFFQFLWFTRPLQDNACRFEYVPNIEAYRRLEIYSDQRSDVKGDRVQPENPSTRSWCWVLLSRMPLLLSISSLADIRDARAKTISSTQICILYSTINVTDLTQNRERSKLFLIQSHHFRYLDCSSAYWTTGLTLAGTKISTLGFIPSTRLSLLTCQCIPFLTRWFLWRMMSRVGARTPSPRACMLNPGIPICQPSGTNEILELSKPHIPLALIWQTSHLCRLETATWSVNLWEWLRLHT